MDVGRQGEEVIAGFAPEHDAGQHPALGAVEAGELGFVGAQLLHVVGEQVVQEGAGVFTAGADCTKVGSSARHRALGRADHILPGVFGKLTALSPENWAPWLARKVCQVAFISGRS